MRLDLVQHPGQVLAGGRAQHLEAGARQQGGRLGHLLQVGEVFIVEGRLGLLVHDLQDSQQRAVLRERKEMDQRGVAGQGKANPAVVNKLLVGRLGE